MMTIFIVYEQTEPETLEACSAFTNEKAAKEYANREHECILLKEKRDAKLVVCEVDVFDSLEESDASSHELREC